MPYFPLGFASFGDTAVCSGLRQGDTVYLAVWLFEHGKKLEIPFEKDILQVTVGYPRNKRHNYGFKDNVLTVTSEKQEQAVFFEIELK